MAMAMATDVETWNQGKKDRDVLMARVGGCSSVKPDESSWVIIFSAVCRGEQGC